MALGPIGRVIVGTAITGVAGCIGISSYFLLGREEEIEIEKLINKEHTGKVILDSTNKAKGVEIWTRYKTDNANRQQDEWTISGWPVSETEPVTSAPDGLVNACQRKKRIKVSDNKNQMYLNFVKWCLVNKAG